MKRIVALVVAALLLLVIVLPAFADPTGAGEFSPGDAPPRSPSAGSAGCGAGLDCTGPNNPHANSNATTTNPGNKFP